MSVRNILIAMSAAIFVVSFLPVVTTAYSFLSNIEKYENKDLSFVIGLGVICSSSLLSIVAIVLHFEKRK